jgi:hypothetical protein
MMLAPPGASPPSWPGDLDEFRAAVRDWCGAHVPAGWRREQAGASDEEFVRFQKWWFFELRQAGLAVHGGMGYTWESGIHVYLKRAALNRSLFGSPRGIAEDRGLLTPVARRVGAKAGYEQAHPVAIVRHAGRGGPQRPTQSAGRRSNDERQP